jgi:formate dehydrogenase (NADP+) beta subunit
MIRFIVDGKHIEAQEGKSVLESSLAGGIYIPHLCHHADLRPIGACRLCVVEIDGMEGLQTACMTPISEGMVVNTKSEAIDHMRRLAMELMLAGHPPDCGTCVKYLNCELQSIKQYLVGDELIVRRRSKLFPVLSSNPLFLLDPNKCILCGRCVRACHELRGVGVLFYKKSGKETYIGTAENIPLTESGCRFCGACAEVCPTGAIMDKEEFGKGKSRKAALVPCRFSCPAEIDVPRYIRFIREKKYAEAVAVIREKVPLPRILGYVCDQPCERACRRREINQAISIRNLKRYAVEHDERELWQRTSVKKPSTDRKVAIIGSGPAGLTAAYYLVNQGHSVKIFESLPLAGGMLRYGIPEYRLPRDVIDEEIGDIEKMGVEIQANAFVESVDTLLNEGYDAVLVAVGANKGLRLNIPGANGEDVLIGTDFLKAVNEGKHVEIGKKVTVLGGGNVAFDCARVALRIGAAEVRMACLEREADMPAGLDEIEQGKEEGIILCPARTCTGIIRKNGRVEGTEFLEVESFSLDEDKNIEIETVDDSRHVLETDTVIFAVGQKPEAPEGTGLNITLNGLIEIDPYTFVTTVDGVFAAGDSVTGTGSVIRAIASGRKAAMAIDKSLGGRGSIEEKFAPVTEPEKRLGQEEGFAGMTRCEERHAPPSQRVHSFCKVVEDVDEQSAVNESKRCLQCDLRLMIKPVKFWVNY